MIFHIPHIMGHILSTARNIFIIVNESVNMVLRKKKAILFDNDGVLADTEGLFFDATKKVLSKVNIDVSSELYIDYCLKCGKSLFDLAKENGFSDNEVGRLRAERDALYAKDLSCKNTAMPDVENMLRKLHGMVCMGVVTTAKRKHIDIMHRNTGFLKYFDFIVTIEDYEYSKPAPDPYLKGIEMSGLDATDCIAVEDSLRGLKSALSANIDCVIIPNRLTKHSDFSGCVKIVKNANELSDYLLKRI